MANPRCNYCGERHDIWDHCAATGREKVLKKEIKMTNSKQITPRQRPEAMKLHWEDGRTTVLLGRQAPSSAQKVQPLYPAQGASMVSYQDAADQLAYSMHGTTLNQLDDKTAEQVRHLARATVNAAIGVQ